MLNIINYPPYLSNIFTAGCLHHTVERMMVEHTRVNVAHSYCRYLFAYLLSVAMKWQSIAMENCLRWKT